MVRSAGPHHDDGGFFEYVFDFVVSSPWKFVTQVNDLWQHQGPILSKWIQEQVGEAIVVWDVHNNRMGAYLTSLRSIWERIHGRRSLGGESD